MVKRIVPLTSVSVFLLITMVVTLVAAQPRNVGVNVGDWFKYGDVTGSWSSNDPNATIPSFAFNDTEWMRMSVQGIVGTNVTGQMTAHYVNGTEESDEGWIDIDTGEASDAIFWLIAGNLDAGHSIYSSANYSTWTVNETIVRTYPDGVRNINHLNSTMEYNMSFPIEIYQYVSMNFYWDKTSGVLVEWSQEYQSQIGGNLTNWLFTIRISESNVWVVPEFSTWTIMLFTLIVLTVVITIYKRGLLKTTIH